MRTSCCDAARLEASGFEKFRLTRTYPRMREAAYPCPPDRTRRPPRACRECQRATLSPELVPSRRGGRSQAARAKARRQSRLRPQPASRASWERESAKFPDRYEFRVHNLYSARPSDRRALARCAGTELSDGYEHRKDRRFWEGTALVLTAPLVPEGAIPPTPCGEGAYLTSQT
jgi:hypothetical protein